jgi:hypothetical protein
MELIPMTKPRLYLAVIVLCDITFTSGCLVRRINKLWPPTEPAAIQLKAIEYAQQELSTLNRSDVYASVAVAEIKRFLPPVLVASTPGIQSVSVQTSFQELVAQVAFDKEFDATDPASKPLKIRLTGQATINAALVVEGQNPLPCPAFNPAISAATDQSRAERTANSPAASPGQDLIICPSFGTIKLRRIVINGGSVPKTIVDIINGLLNTFINNINGTLHAQRISLSFDYVTTLSPQALLSSLPGVHDIAGDPIKFSVALDKGAVLVDDVGIHALAKLTENGRTVEYAAAVRASLANDPVQEAYDKYKAQFLAAAQRDLGAIPPDYWSGTDALVAKSYTSALINDTLGDLKFAAGFAFPDTGTIRFDQDLQADPAPDLNCAGRAAQTSCDIQMECSQTRDCNPHWNCESCAWYDLGCDARRLGCEADKVRYRAQCEAEKEAARLGCEADKARLRAQCEVQKAIDQALCDVNQAWLNAWSGAKFGNVQGDVKLSGIDAKASLSRVAVPDDLSALAINSTIQAESQANANFVFTPLDAGHLLCQVPWGGPVSVRAGLPAQQLNMSAALRGVSPGADAGINLIFNTVDYALSLKTVPPPMVAITTQNPQFFLACGPAVVLAGPFLFIKKFREDLLQDTFNFKLPAQQFTVGVQPIHFQVLGSDLKLNPEWNTKTVGFRLVPVGQP